MQPNPTDVGALAVRHLETLVGDQDYGRLRESTLLYPDCWKCMEGYPMIDRWDQTADSPPLFDEAMRVIALKAAVFDLTGDEHAAELVVPAPVDEMIHATIAQFSLCFAIRQRTGVAILHMTDRERFTFDSATGEGAYSVACYRAAGWGEPPARYWIGGEDAARRRAHLGDLYAAIGFTDFGRSHQIDFSGRHGTAAVVAAG